MKNNLELAGKVLQWWNDHQYDVVTDEVEDHNVFNGEPEMVTLAKQIIAKVEKDIGIDDVTLCVSCFCVTHTIKGKCGKCKGAKK